MWWGHMNEYGWGGKGMGIGMLLFWGVLVAAIVVLTKNIWGTNTCESKERGLSALDILKERYARGDIECEEFEQKKRALTE